MKGRRRNLSRRSIRRRRRRVIYKPDYARVRQIAVTKRVVGVLLALLLAFAALAIVFAWLLPSLAKTLEPSPLGGDASAAQAQGETSAAEPLGYDEETGLPLYDDAFNLFIINAEHPAESDFCPILVSAAGVQVDERIAPALTGLTEAAQADGVELTFASGCVLYGEQLVLYEKQVKALVAAGYSKIMAREDAKRTVPAPGESDLQSGLCVTLAGDAATFSDSAAYGWLQSHMGKYGFVFRYPAGKEDYTGVESNDLVLRYVGPENAAAMRRLSMCLEEYIDYVG